MTSKNYAFAMNIKGIKDRTELVLPGAHILRLATTEEASDISRNIDALRGGLQMIKFHWQQQDPNLPSGHFRVDPDPSEFRFFVIEFQDMAETLELLQQAFDLSPIELEIGFTRRADGGMSWKPSRLVYLDAVDRETLAEISSADVRETAVITEQIHAHNHGVVNVRAAISELEQLKGLPHNSQLRILGYFALIESLLTHAPKGTDPYDSITRQIKKKLILIGNRWPDRINYTGFGSIAMERLWSLMYEYRSAVAHGAAIDLTVKLKPLGSRERVFSLAKSAAKAVIRFCLDEPQLAKDLREC